MEILSFREIVELGRLQVYMPGLKYETGEKISEFFPNVATNEKPWTSSEHVHSYQKEIQEQSRKDSLDGTTWLRESLVKDSSTTFWAKKYCFPSFW